VANLRYNLREPELSIALFYALYIGTELCTERV